MIDGHSLSCSHHTPGISAGRLRPRISGGTTLLLITLTLVITCLVAATSATARQHPKMPEVVSGSYEVFPLRVGLRRTYAYVRIDASGGLGYSTMDKDSGLVSYEIVDSSQLDDTTIVWEILEINALMKHKYAGGWWSYDSTYRIDTTIHFTLTERTTGDHEVTSVSRIWSFPLRYGYNNASSIAVYRYFNTPQVYISRYYSTCLELTTSFSVDSGFTSGYRYPYCGVDYGDGWAVQTTTSYMVSEPITAASPDHLLPAGYSLEQNYPNPFNPQTVIEFSLPVSGYTSLKIFNLLGQEVADLVGEDLPAGAHRVRWDATGVPTGVYLYRMRSGSFHRTMKLTVMR